MRYRPSLRAVIVATLLLATAGFLHARHRREIIPVSDKLARLPNQLGGWSGHDLAIPSSFLEILGPGDFLSRLYTQPQQPPIDLFLAYLPSQSAGDTIHSPKNCLPGSGWVPVESTQIMMMAPDGGSFPANRYVIAKGTDKDIVLYWYQAHGRAVASEYWAKFYLVADAIRMNRTDGSLIRIVTPIAEGEDLAAAQARAVSFAKQLMPELNRFIPR